MDRTHCYKINGRKHKNNDTQGILYMKSIGYHEKSCNGANQNPNGRRTPKKYSSLPGNKFFHLFFRHANGAKLSELMNSSNDGKVKHAIHHKNAGKKNHPSHQAVNHHGLHIHRTGVQIRLGRIYIFPLNSCICPNGIHEFSAFICGKIFRVRQFRIDCIGFIFQLASFLGIAF